jgi:hypothetical protein
VVSTANVATSTGALRPPTCTWGQGVSCQPCEIGAFAVQLAGGGLGSSPRAQIVPGARITNLLHFKFD